jgi:hypothetical protein
MSRPRQRGRGKQNQSNEKGGTRDVDASEQASACERVKSQKVSRAQHRDLYLSSATSVQRHDSPLSQSSSSA